MGLGNEQLHLEQMGKVVIELGGRFEMTRLVDPVEVVDGVREGIERAGLSLTNVAVPFVAKLDVEVARVHHRLDPLPLVGTPNDELEYQFLGQLRRVKRDLTGRNRFQGETRGAIGARWGDKMNASSRNLNMENTGFVRGNGGGRVDDQSVAVDDKISDLERRCRY